MAMILSERLRSLVAVGALMVLTLLLYLPNIGRSLPVTHEPDEPIYATAALRMIANNSFNPQWFGNPGSTTIYPLAALYLAVPEYLTPELLTRAVTARSPIAQLPPDLLLLGRLLSVIYAVATIPLLYALGKELHSRTVGLIGGLLWAWYPLAVYYGQFLRTDSAATCFTVAALWLLLRSLRTQAKRDWILAGAAAGLAISSRYFMGALLVLPLFMLIENGTFSRDRLRFVVWFYGSVIIAFALTSPFVILSFGSSATNVLAEARMEHLGSDGFSQAGNIVWYLARAIPSAISWPQWLLALIGFSYAVYQQNIRALLLVAFLVTFVVGISAFDLHWQRWIIQLLPVLAVGAALGIVFVAERFSRRAIVVGLTLLVMLWPAWQLYQLHAFLAHPTTRVTAGVWVQEHVSPRDSIVTEMATAPLDPRAYNTLAFGWLGRDVPPEFFTAVNVRFLILNRNIQDLFNREAERFAFERSFFDRLLPHYRLVQTIVPERRCPLLYDDHITNCGSPTIVIYELAE